MRCKSWYKESLYQLFFNTYKFYASQNPRFYSVFSKLTKFSFFIKFFSKSIKVFFTFIPYFP